METGLPSSSQWESVGRDMGGGGTSSMMVISITVWEKPEVTL